MSDQTPGDKRLPETSWIYPAGPLPGQPARPPFDAPPGVGAQQPPGFGTQQQPPGFGVPPPPYAQQPPAFGYGQPGHSNQYGGSFFLAVMGQEQGPYQLGHLTQMANSGTLRPDTMVRADGATAWFPAKEIPGLYSDKELSVAAIISFFLGSLGIDRFYLGYTGLGIAKLVTLGGCGIWSLIDFILILTRKVPDAQGRPLR